MIALAKARPGELNYGAVAIGASTHLASELFKVMAGVDIVHVPYKSSGGAVTPLLSGQLQVMFGTTGTVMTHVKSGRLRPLAISTAQPSALAPGLPTIAAAGNLPGYESAATAGVFAPALSLLRHARRPHYFSVNFRALQVTLRAIDSWALDSGFHECRGVLQRSSPRPASQQE